MAVKKPPMTKAEYEAILAAQQKKADEQRADTRRANGEKVNGR